MKYLKYVILGAIILGAICILTCLILWSANINQAEEPILKVLIVPVNPKKTYSYYITINADGFLSVSKGRVKNYQILKKNIMSEDCEEKTVFLSSEQFQKIIGLLDEIYEKEAVDQGIWEEQEWMIDILYKGKVRSDYYLLMPEPVKNLMDEIISISPIEIEPLE